jgi:NAD(P)-dependent dehydrogenase (short-subunit alcohol dehydrogenase family)
MARIFITGSADGLGQLAAKMLISQGHQVVLHARNEDRGRQAISKLPGAEKILIADLSDVEATKQLAADANASGQFDAVIHNAGVYQVSDKIIFMVNTLAPYILTCLIQKPKRLIYLSSGMHLQGDTSLTNLITGSGRISYSDSKFHAVMLAMAVARKWPDVYSNSVNPGWVPTKMGGRGAPDDLDQGAETQTWLAVSNDEKAKVSGRYFFHKKEARHRPEAADVALQDKFLTLCEQITGVHFPT